MKLDADLKKDIVLHLTSNYYPPLPASLAGPAAEAVRAVAEGEGEREIELPEGFQDSCSTIPAHEMVEALRLEAFVDQKQTW